MQVAYQKSFPDTATEILDYVFERGEEPCGPSIPGDIMAMVGFFEDIGAREESKKLSKNSMIKTLISDLRLELSTGRPAIRKKAHQHLTAMVAVWETMVCSPDLTVALRINAWTKLVKIWGALRTGDLAGIPARGVKLVNGSLTGRIVLSKTTGSGKRVSATNFHVHKSAWLLQPDWLSTGWDCYKQFMSDREFFVPLPTKDMGALGTKEPSYMQGCTADRKMIAETPMLEKVDEDDWDRPTLASAVMLEVGAQNFWAGHSDRATLSTWSAGLKISKDRRDFIGRWRPSDSDEYVRTSREIVWGIQSEVAEKIRHSAGEDVCHEEGLIEELASYCSERGMAPESIEAMVQRIAVSRKIFEGTAWQTLTAIEPEPIEPAKVVVALDPEPPEAPFDGLWVVSQSGTGAHETLHQIGKCWRVPGTHYKRYVILDDGELDGPVLVGRDKLYTRVCADCFPKGLEGTAESSESSSSGETISSDSEGL